MCNQLHREGIRERGQVRGRVGGRGDLTQWEDEKSASQNVWRIEGDVQRVGERVAEIFTTVIMFQ